MKQKPQGPSNTADCGDSSHLPLLSMKTADALSAASHALALAFHQPWAQQETPLRVHCRSWALHLESLIPGMSWNWTALHTC